MFPPAAVADPTATRRRLRAAGGAVLRDAARYCFFIILQAPVQPSIMNAVLVATLTTTSLAQEPTMDSIARFPRVEEAISKVSTWCCRPT